MANHRVYMKLYVGDYLADTADLNATESGAYLHLIMHYWQHGGLPDDDRKLAAIAKVTPYQWEKFRGVLQKFFRHGWRHKRIDRELQLADEAHEKRSRAAVIGNAAKLAMRSQSGRNATHIQRRYTTTETVPRARGSGRPRKEDLEPSPELLEAMDRKGQKH